MRMKETHDDLSDVTSVNDETVNLSQPSSYVSF